ncbi:MAG: hypothetical protein AABX55_02075 [Nanoarchaeota archaeon]
MPNPRYIKDGKLTEELEFKLKLAHYVYISELEPFCKGYGYDHELENLRNVKGVYLIGSHAQESGWDDEKSDIDFRLLIPNMLPEAFDQYKRKILDAKLHIGKKPDWIDLFASQRDDQILQPMYNLTNLWKEFNQEF